MQFVKNITSLPVPQLYAHWQIPKDISGEPSLVLGCIVMERKPGNRIRRFQCDLSKEQKEYLFSQLHQYLDELRRIPQPPPIGWIESPVGSCYDERLTWGDRFGPFHNEKEFHNWCISTHDWQVQHNPELYRRAHKTFRDDHKIVFTHGDLSEFNIHIEVKGPEVRDACVVGLLDWETAAWIPEYWEPIKMMHGNSNKDWEELVTQIFPGYEKEIKVDMKLLYMSGRPY